MTHLTRFTVKKYTDKQAMIVSGLEMQRQATIHKISTL